MRMERKIYNSDSTTNVDSFVREISDEIDKKEIGSKEYFCGKKIKIKEKLKFT